MFDILRDGLPSFVLKVAVIAGVAAVAAPPPAYAVVDGVTGTSFSLVAKSDYINTADGKMQATTRWI